MLLKYFDYDFSMVYENNPFDESIEVSQSLMNQYFMCEGRVGYSSDPRYKDSPGEKTIFGTVAHFIMEDHFEGEVKLILTSQMVSEYLDMALDKDRTSREELGITKSDELMFVDELLLWYQQFKDSSLAEELSDNIIAMEQRRYMPLGFTPDGMPIVLAGTPDLIVEGNRGPTIKDLKTTSSSKWSTATVQMSKQPDVYLALTRSEFKTEDFEFLVWLRHKSEWLRFYTSRNDKTINATLQQAYVIGCKVESGLFVPNPIDYKSWTNKRAWFCGPKWCGAWDFCDFKDIHDDVNLDEPSIVSWK